ncbi:hypothetical protein ACFL6X_02095 [Candidatus Latescibacterota bacterium]
MSFRLMLHSSDEVSRLVEMTPYKWHMSRETAARIAKMEELEDEASFVVRVASPARA